MRHLTTLMNDRKPGMLMYAKQEKTVLRHNRGDRLNIFLWKRFRLKKRILRNRFNFVINYVEYGQ